MMLTVATKVGIVDRTGLLQWAASRVDVEVVDIPLTAFARAELPDLDVLLVGSRELSATGLRRLERWTRSHPASVAIAHTEDEPVDRGTLRAAGTHHVVRGRLTPAKFAGALRRADASLGQLLTATGRFRLDGAPEIPRQQVEQRPAPVAAPAPVEVPPAVDFDELDEELDSLAADDDLDFIEGDDADAIDDGYVDLEQDEDVEYVDLDDSDEITYVDLDGSGDLVYLDTAEQPTGSYPRVDRVTDTRGLDTGRRPGTRQARLVTVASATGGCGKTFFSTNAAALLARAGNRVLLVDLDLQFGEVAPALRIHHPYSLYDGLYTNTGQRLPATSFAEHLDELVHHHPLGFDVLTAPRDPVLADYVGARDAATVLDAVSDKYDVVIADTPPSLNDVVIAALDRSVSVLVLATLDVPSLRNMAAFLDVLRRLGLDDNRIELVLNKAEKDVGVTVAQANESFAGRFHSVLPLDRAVSRAVNLGTTVVTHEPRARVSRALVPALERLAETLGVPHAAMAQVEPESRGRMRPLFQRMFRRPALGGNS